jgi:uncharacterized damage-inducible protein DinB
MGGMDRERADLLDTLGKHRGFLRFTVRDLTDEQAAATPTVSALCLGGLLKHVAAVEERWADFMVRGPDAFPPVNEAEMTAHAATFRMAEGETLQAIVEASDGVARRTDELVATVGSLDTEHPLPAAPWFEPGATWTVRRAIVHIVAETAQHAGHADIIREAIDGAKTMG